MDIEQLADALEPFVDDNGLAAVIDALGLMCAVKADHIRASYSDETTAAVWDRMAANFSALEGADQL